LRTFRIGSATLAGRRPAAAAVQPARSLPDPEPDVQYTEATLLDSVSGFPDARMTVRGLCMHPALAEGEKLQVVATAQRPPRVGDVVLVRQPGGLHLHRLVWGPPVASPRGPWRTMADRGRQLDPAIGPDDVLGVVTQIEGRGAPRRAGRAAALLARAVAFRLRHGARRPAKAAS
jgi:hypothetical protein